MISTINALKTRELLISNRVIGISSVTAFRGVRGAMIYMALAALDTMVICDRIRGRSLTRGGRW
jgi:hypothetical protein